MDFGRKKSSFLIVGLGFWVCLVPFVLGRSVLLIGRDIVIAEEMALDKIRPYQYNPRNNDGAVDVVANSIREFGWQQPILVDEELTIINGHTRYAAAQKLGMEKVPVVVAKGLSPEKARQLRLADNKVSEYSKWDWETLQSELEAIQGIEMKQYGFMKVDKADLMPKSMKEEKKKKDKAAGRCTCPRCGREFEV